MQWVWVRIGKVKTVSCADWGSGGENEEGGRIALTSFCVSLLISHISIIERASRRTPRAMCSTARGIGKGLDPLSIGYSTTD